MITQKEIAKICNVSVATVSNVINGKAKASEETTRRILEAIEANGYRPNAVARGLRTKRTNMIAVIAEDVAQFTSPPVISSIMEVCEKKGYRVVVYNLRLYDRWSDTWYDHENAYHSVLDPVLQNVRASGADGVIYLAGHARNIRCFPDKPSIPVVMAYAFSADPWIPSVVIDDEQSACEMIKYLISMGHRRIAFIGGRSDNLHTQHRLEGYQRALFETGILYDPDLVYYGNWTRVSGYEGAKTLLEKKPDAFFSISDKMAGGIYDYLAETELVIGRDISVAGFDDESIAAFFRPQLTTTALPLTEIGEIAAGRILDMLEGKAEEAGEAEGEEQSEEPVVIKVPCTMKVRDSVADHNGNR
ncbi:MAG: LacI family DNA-binding transcriptional regulator [Lachnospiraceae bacterium]|nr:LacI family DNA-binding transcriptional regulator [Lachnospiraceae bacterium]